MLDLPPDIPVISACADALHAGWQEAETCLFDLGFEYAVPTPNLEQVEIDYWTALNLLNGRPPEEAVPQGDTTEALPFDTVLEHLDSAFLLVDFDNNSSERGGIHRVYEGVEGAVVLTTDPASACLSFFTAKPWSGFEAAFHDVENEFGETESHSIGSLARTRFYDRDVTFLQDVLYRVFPSAWPDTGDWELFAINPNEFQTVFGKEPVTLFHAQYNVTRKY